MERRRAVPLKKKRINPANYQWYWWSNTQWIPYQPEDNNNIQQAYNNKFEEFKFTCNNWGYKIVFQSSLQINIKTGTSRKIKREPPIQPPIQPQLQQQPQRQPQRQQLQQCNICYSEEKLLSLPSCAHPPEVCSNCITNYLKSEIGSNKASIKCTNSQCAAIFSSVDISMYLGSSHSNQWLEVSLRNYVIQGDSNIRNCANPKCSFPWEVNPETDTYFTCSLCNTRTCIRHREIFHDGISCEEYDRIHLPEQTNNTKVKKCPKCMALVEKVGGCSHIKCVCGFEFCWKCLVPFEPIRQNGNHFHKENCKFYRPEYDH